MNSSPSSSSSPSAKLPLATLIVMNSPSNVRAQSSTIIEVIAICNQISAIHEPPTCDQLQLKIAFLQELAKTNRVFVSKAESWAGSVKYLEIGDL
jgi:hypothetical protein